MSYNVTIYQFAKKKNSTKQPDYNSTPKYNFTCQLMNDSGIINPTFIFNFSEIQNVQPGNYNYAYVSEWNRYYFITDWRYIGGLWECLMTVDSLASWQHLIGAHTGYVLRSAYTYDDYLPDNMYPARTGATYSVEQNVSNPFATAFSNGYFVVGIINNDTGTYGAVSYYVLTSTEFRTFSNYLLSNVAYLNVSDISSDLLKCLYNPFQYVVSCTWLPFQPPLGSYVSSVPIGWWTTPATGYRLSGYVRASGTVTCQIPRNPEGADKHYMDAEPYTEYYLDFPPFGSFTLSADKLVNATYLDMAWNVDCITGMGRLQMGAANTEPFNIVHAQIGVPVQLAQMSPNMFGAFQQALGSTGFAWADTIINTLGSIGNALIAKELPMQTTGNTGGFMAGYYPIRLVGMFHGIVEQNNAEFGRPLCKTKQLSTIPGFMILAHGDFAGTPCLSYEIDEINSYFTSGFFYET